MTPNKNFAKKNNIPQVSDTMQLIKQEIELQHSLARAVVCRTLRLGFQTPSETSLKQLFSEEGRRVIREASRFLDGAGAGAMTNAASALSTLPEAVLRESIESYDSLIGHTTRGKICPYETEYGGEAIFLQAHELANIAGYFLAFGLQPRADAGERPDHIAVEWEYLEFLSEKEALALEKQDYEMLEETRKAYRGFLRDHLSCFGRAFSSSLVKEDPHGLYGALARLCQAFLESECRRLSLPLGAEFLPLRAGLLDDAPMACGSESELMQID